MRTKRNWAHALIGSALGLALIGGGAAAFAASQPQAATSRQNRIQGFLDDVASRLGVQPATLTGAIQAAELDQLNQAVAAKRISATRAAAIEARIKAGKIGPLGFGWAGHRRVRLRFGLKTAAAYIGVPATALRADLKNGQSLAQVATANGKTATGLEQALLAPVKTRLDKAAASGKLTAAKEQTILQRIQTRIDRLVNRDWTTPAQTGPQTGNRG